MSIPALAAALAATALMAACVAPVPYNQRVPKGAIYQQLDAQFSGNGAIDEVKLEQLQNLVKLTLGNATLFPAGGAELDDSGKAILTKLAPALKGLSADQRIVVKSFTDSTVTGVRRPVLPNTVELTKARAAAIAALLATQGVSAQVIYTSGLGESHPVASNELPQDRAQNRRVEIDVVEAPA